MAKLRFVIRGEGEDGTVSTARAIPCSMSQCRAGAGAQAGPSPRQTHDVGQNGGDYPHGVSLSLGLLSVPSHSSSAGRSWELLAGQHPFLAARRMLSPGQGSPFPCWHRGMGA